MTKSNLPRKDTLDLKQQLAHQCKSQSLGQDYWLNFKCFLTGKINKSDFDTVALKCLTDRGIKLHNQLITGILYNCSHALSTPDSLQDSREFHVPIHVQNDLYDLQHNQQSIPALRNRHTRQVIMSLSTEDRDRLLSNGSGTSTGGGPVLHASRKLSFPTNPGEIPKSCKEEHDLPSMETLKQRIKFICACHGLSGDTSEDVPQETVELLSLGLETYLKNFLEPIFETTRSFPLTPSGCDSIPSSDDLLMDTEGHPAQVTDVDNSNYIDKRDLQLAFTVHPPVSNEHVEIVNL